MPADVRAASKAAATASVVVTKPTGTVSGDVLIAFHFGDWDTAAEMTAPAGWSQVGATVDFGANNLHGKMWQKVAGASEPADYTFAGGASTDMAVHLFAVSGADTTPTLVSAGVTDTSPSVVTAPSVTPSGTDDLLLCAGGAADNAAATWAAPTGMTSNGQAQSGSFCSAAAASLQLTSGAATGGKDFSHSTGGAANAIGFSVAVKSASGTTPVNIAGSPGTARARRPAIGTVSIGVRVTGTVGTARGRAPAPGTVSTASSVTITGAPGTARARGTEGVLTIATIVTVGGPATARARATPTGTVTVGVRIAGAPGTARARTAPAGTLAIGVTIAGSPGTARGRAPAAGTVTVGSSGAVTITGTPGTARGRAALAGTVTIGVTVNGSSGTARARRAPSGAVTTGVVVTATPGTARARRTSPGTTTVGVTVTTAPGTARARSGPAQASADADLTVTLGPTVTRWVTGSIITRWAGGHLVTRWHVGRPTRGGGYTVHLLSVPAASTDYVLVPVTVAIAGAGVATDPTTMSVAIAVTPEGTTPVTADWRAATWETAGGVTYARLLVGPGAGGLALAAGRYTVWVRITSSPEVPVRAAGTLLLT